MPRTRSTASMADRIATQAKVDIPWVKAPETSRIMRDQADQASQRSRRCGEMFVGHAYSRSHTRELRARDCASSSRCPRRATDTLAVSAAYESQRPGSSNPQSGQGVGEGVSCRCPSSHQQLSRLHRLSQRPGSIAQLVEHFLTRKGSAGSSPACSHHRRTCR